MTPRHTLQHKVPKHTKITHTRFGVLCFFVVFLPERLPLTVSSEPGVDRAFTR